MIAFLVLQVAAAVLIGFATSALALRALPGLRDRAGVSWGAPERALLSVAGFVLFAVGLMVGNLVTGGAVFGTPWVVPVAAVAVILATRREIVAVAIAVRDTGSAGTLTRRVLPWAVAAVVLGALYVWPIVVGGSGARTGDVPSHLGWTAQLLGGEPVPAGAAPEVSDNAYPWGLHAVMATLVRAVPGSDALVAIDALHVLLVAALPLAAAGLARRVRPESGWAAAACCTLIGGFGWVAAGEPDLVLSPIEARYGADLVVASPNSIYELFPPALPRELGLVLLGSAGVLLMLALQSGNRRVWIAAGVGAGMTGLVSVPLFICALLWGVTAVVVAADKGNLRRDLLPPLAVFGLWAGPVAAGYASDGGFVDITARLGVEWRVIPALVAWGVLFPLAVAGALILWRDRRRSDVSGWSGQGIALLAFTGATVLLLIVAYARNAFDWEIANNATLLHTGRYWPPLHLVGAALAGVAVVFLYRLLAGRAVWAGAAGVAVVLGVGAISPVFASIRLTEIIEDREDGYIYGDLDRDSFVRAAAGHLNPDDVLLVRGPPELAYAIFQFSGVRLARYDDERFARNDLRIRYADLARRWDRAMAAGGYEPDFIVCSSMEAGEGGFVDPVLIGGYGGRTWVLEPAGRGC